MFLELMNSVQTNFNQITIPTPNPDVERAAAKWTPWAFTDAPNPEGAAALRVVNESRNRVAKLIQAAPEDVVFTASDAEAANHAIKGIALAAPKPRRQILLSPVEHAPVHDAARFLESLGFKVIILPAAADGRVSPEDVRKHLSQQTALAALQWASREIGTLQDIEGAARVCREFDVPLVVDGSAASGLVPMRTFPGVTCLTVSSVTMGGPTGSGALWIRPGTRTVPLIHGGIEEEGRRAGPENVGAIAGFGKAAAMVEYEPEATSEAQTLRALLDQAIPNLVWSGPNSVSTDSGTRLPRHLSFCIPEIESEALVLGLADEYLLATGSTCSKAGLPSRVLSALGVPQNIARGSLSLSWRRGADFHGMAAALAGEVKRLRQLSPAVEIKS